MKYKPGQLVLNPKLGLGKVLDVAGDSVTVFFKDQTENPRTINVAVVPMDLAPDQADPAFSPDDNLDKMRKTTRPRPTAAKKKRAAATAG